MKRRDFLWTLGAAAMIPATGTAPLNGELEEPYYPTLELKAKAEGLMRGYRLPS